VHLGEFHGRRSVEDVHVRFEYLKEKLLGMMKGSKK
jgi:hypothetical protein